MLLMLIRFAWRLALMLVRRPTMDVPAPYPEEVPAQLAGGESAQRAAAGQNRGGSM